ncbi:hypothetical protein JVU11DRAFT_663 [Chiua virens]|nr:hypothetical protein JVU11DRAFT_663 [Chiua virens]
MSSRGGRQSMSELRYRRLLEHNQRLREDLARPRIRVSEASARSVVICLQTHRPYPSVYSLIRHCKTTKDHLVPSVWGPVQKAEDPYAPQGSRGPNCCNIQ